MDRRKGTVKVRCNRCGTPKIIDIPEGFEVIPGTFVGDHQCGDGNFGEFVIESNV